MQLRRLAAALLTAALAIAALEVGVRLAVGEPRRDAVPGPPQDAAGPTIMKGNPYLLWEYSPGVLHEKGQAVHINRLGLRGPERDIPKPPGTRRVLVTGDSSVYGFGVADHEVLTAFTERRLAAMPGSGRVEVIDAAIPGYSTFQTINLLRMRALRLEPDVVVIGNLWSDNHFGTFVDRELLDAWGSWDRSPTGRVRGVLEHLALFRLLDQHIRVEHGARARARKVGWTLGEGPRSGRRRVAIGDYVDNLQTLVDMAHRAGAEVAFLLLACREDLDGPDQGRAWSIYRRAMRDVAARTGAPLLDVPALLRASRRPADALFLDEMHPTPEGHRRIGEALADLLAGWRRGEPLEGPGEDRPLGPYIDRHTGVPRGPDGGAAPGGPTVAGEVRWTTRRGRRIQVDAVRDRADGPPEVVGSARLAAPGPFRIVVSSAGPLRFVLVDDLAGDGPTPDDPRALPPVRLEAGVEPVEGILLDGDAAELRDPGRPPGSPPQEAAREASVQPTSR